jgi:hypothetical protein
LAADLTPEIEPPTGGLRVELLPAAPPLLRRQLPEGREAPPISPRALVLAVALFLLSLASTTTLGAIWTLLARSDVETDLEPLLSPRTIVAVWSDPHLLRSGLEFALPALFILLCHEMGHWIACRRHRLPATLPYFLPAPVGLGTFGAFIRIRAPVRSKRQLLDVGVWGPLAGFLALLPVLVAGVALSHPELPTIRGVPPGVELDLYRPGESLLLLGLIRLFHGALPAGEILQPHPLLLAGWFGLFATMLNLLPLAQLDGGHVFYAAAGSRQRRWAWPLWGALVLLGFAWSGWWLWSVIVLLMRVRHPRVLDEREPLDRRRKLLAGAALAIFVIGFMPTPIRVERLVAVPSGGRTAGLGKVEHQRHRAVVDELDLHVRAEAAALDGDAELAQPRDQPVDPRRGELRQLRALEGRAATARRRGEEGELRHDEQGAADGAKVAVESAAFVFEEPQAGDLFRRPVGQGVVVAARHTDQRDEATADRRDPIARDLDPRPCDPLQDDAHAFRLFSLTMRPERAAMIATPSEESEPC